MNDGEESLQRYGRLLRLVPFSRRAAVYILPCHLNTSRSRSQEKRAPDRRDRNLKRVFSAVQIRCFSTAATNTPTAIDDYDAMDWHRMTFYIDAESAPGLEQIWDAMDDDVAQCALALPPRRERYTERTIVLRYKGNEAVDSWRRISLEDPNVEESYREWYEEKVVGGTQNLVEMGLLLEA